MATLVFKELIMTYTEQLVYLAGIVDGEGCLTSNKTSQNGRFRPRFTVTSTFQPLIAWCKMLWGGKYYVTHPKNTKKKTSYTWIVHTNQAIELIKCLLPYLKIKKREAKVFISFFKTDVLTSQRLAKELSALKR